MDPSTGLLSHALRLLLETSNNLTNLSGLPPEAQKIQVTAVTLLSDESNDIKAMRDIFSQFVSAYYPGIQQAETDLNNNINIDQVATLITQISQAALTLQQNADALSEKVATTRRNIADLSTGLAPIKMQLENQRISLSTDLQLAAQEAESTRDRLENMEGLRVIFGDTAVDALATLLGVQEERVQALEYKVNSLQDQITSLETFMRAIDLMSGDFREIMSTISNVANCVTYISSDTSIVVKDLRNVLGKQAMAKLYILNTRHRLEILQQDAA